jgi:hypothetical protein
LSLIFLCWCAQGSCILIAYVSYCCLILYSDIVLTCCPACPVTVIVTYNWLQKKCNLDLCGICAFRSSEN